MLQIDVAKTLNETLKEIWYKVVFTVRFYGTMTYTKSTMINNEKFLAAHINLIKIFLIKTLQTQNQRVWLHSSWKRKRDVLFYKQIW